MLTETNDPSLEAKAAEYSSLAEGAGGPHSKLGKFYAGQAREASTQIELDRQIEDYRTLLQKVETACQGYLSQRETAKPDRDSQQQLQLAKSTLLEVHQELVAQAALLLRQNSRQTRELISHTLYTTAESLSRSQNIEFISLGGDLIRQMLAEKLPRATDLLWNEKMAFVDCFLNEYQTEKSKYPDETRWYSPGLIAALESAFSLINELVKIPGTNQSERANYFSESKVIEAKNVIRKIWRMFDTEMAEHEDADHNLTNPRAYWREMTEEVLNEKLSTSAFQILFQQARDQLQGIFKQYQGII